MRKKPVTKETALSRLSSLCARSEQCEFELRRKMTGWGLSREDREEVMEYLSANRYTDDSRFARSYAADKARFSAWGPAKIRAELIKRHIPAGDIKAALENVEPEIWKEGLMKCARSKGKNLDLCGEQGYENRQKVFG